MRAAITQRAGVAKENMNENTKGTQVTKVSERRALRSTGASQCIMQVESAHTAL
jgi:hypothetical protein